MKRLLFFYLLLSSVAWGQLSPTNPQRALYATKAEVRSYPGLSGVFIVVNSPATSGLRTQETFIKDPTDSTSPESDSVIVAAGGIRFKRVTPVAVAAVTSVDYATQVTGKPSTFPPSSHNHTISALTGYSAFAASKQDTLGSGTTYQILTWGRVWRTPDKSWFNLNNVPNVNATIADNLGSGTIPTGRYGTRTVPITSFTQSGATDGQVMKWSTASNAWIPKNDSLGSGGSGAWGSITGDPTTQSDLMTLLNAKVPTSRTATAGTGLTGGGALSSNITFSLANDGVTNTKMAPMANNTIKGNILGYTANPSDVSVLSLPVSTAQQTEINKRVAYRTVSELKAFTSTDVANNPSVFITDSGKEGEFRYVAGSSATDNVGTVLVTTSGGYRYVRTMKDNTYNAEWFKSSGDPHTGTAIKRAVAVAIIALSSDTTATVLLAMGRNTVDTSQILLAVPKGKRLRLQGNIGSTLDFYCPNCDGGIIANSTTGTEADSTYNFGTVELVDIVFNGSRNSTPSYLSSSTGVLGFFFRNMQRVVVHRCRFQNWYGTTGFIGMTGSGEFTNNVTYNVYARQPNVTDARGDGVAIYKYTKNFIITNNRIETTQGKTGRCGISVDDGCQDVIVNNNIITGYERGIHIEGSNIVDIYDNIIKRSPIAGLSSGNKNTKWHHNHFDATNRVCNPELSASAVFFVLSDSACVYESNTVKGWHSLSGTYLAKFWGVDLIIKDNDFRPDANSAFVYANGSSRKRLLFEGNRFHGKCNLDADNTVSAKLEGNTFWGGYVLGQNSTDFHLINNTFKPNIGTTLGEGMVLYGATRPYVSGNTFIDVTSYCIENSSTTNGIFENNTYLRYASSAAAYSYFFVSTGIAATGVKKTAADRYNVIRDYNNNNAYYIGNTGTPTAY